MFSVMLSANNENFISPPLWIPFISFSFLIVVDKTSKTMLNNSDKSGHTCLFPDLRGNAFSFKPFRMFTVGLLYMAFEIRVTTQGESGVLGFPSRRALTPRGNLECNPEIPAFPGFLAIQLDGK